MQKLKSSIIALASVIVVTLSFGKIKAASIERAVESAVFTNRIVPSFNPSLVNFTMDNSQLYPLGTIITATYTSAWGNQTFADRVAVDVTFYQWVGRRPGSIGENVEYHYLIALAYSHSDQYGQAVYTGEYYPSDPNGNSLNVSTRPITSITVINSWTSAIYPYCAVQ